VIEATWPNESLLLSARGGVRQAVAVLAHVARPAALYMMRCSRTPGVRQVEPLPMKMKVRVCSAIVVAISTLVWPHVVRAQRTSDSLEIGVGRVGLLSVGIDVDSLYSLVGRYRTRLVDLFGEGVFGPALEIRLGSDSRVTMLAHIGASRCGHLVSGIDVYDPHYRTRSGLHVGSTLGAVRAQQTVQLSSEEGARAMVPSLGLVFELSSDRFVDSTRVVAVRVGSAPGASPCAGR
jgi:hypothetical protein